MNDTIDLENGFGLEQIDFNNKIQKKRNIKICILLSIVFLSSIIVIPLLLVVLSCGKGRVFQKNQCTNLTESTNLTETCDNGRESHSNQCVIKGRHIPLSIKNSHKGAFGFNHKVVFWDSSILYYVVDADLPLKTKIIVTQAIDEYLLFTNITLLEYHGEFNDNFSYVLFTSDKKGSCNSFVGKQIGWQKLNLGPLCSKKSGIHEIMHALGWSHEQNRLDRNQYLTINYDNIIPTKIHNFLIKPSSLYDKIESKTDFDFDSIMLYHRFAFSINGKVTIDYPEDSDVTKYSFSKTDLQELQMYFLIA
jgi:hypothetical protein